MDETLAPTTRDILVVDDTRASAFMLARLLETLGQKVQVCYDAESALAMVKQRRPDLIFSDIAMPHIDGYEFAQRLRADPALQGITLVALTGYGQESDRRLSKEAGFDHHLVKPISVQSLRSLLLGIKTLKED